MSNLQVQSLTVNGTTYDIVDNTSGYMTGMTILSYGNSTWQDFIDAYTAKKVVYCRASSQSNPATGSQTRLAFMAYVNDAESPTEVEFQYYRSVSSKTESQQGDQVFIYTLTSSGSWSVITREASVKVAVGGDLNGSYSGGTYTISADIPDQNVISVDQKVTTGVNIADIIINGTATALYAPQGGGSGTITRVKTTAGAHTTIDVSSGSASFNIPTNTSHLVNDSGFVTTDEKLKTTVAFNGTYFPLFGAATSTAETKYYSGNFRYSKTTSIDSLQLGQVSSSSTSKGRLTLCSGPYYTYLDPPLYSTISANQTYTLPASTGTIALTSDIPTKTSDLTNDAGYLTSYTETDPTVPSWAKASTKPAYTASEVGAQATLVSGTNIKTINGESILGSGDITVGGLPTVSASDNGKVLTVANGEWAVANLPVYNGAVE